MLSIQNVSQKYSGDWYIKEASHRIDASTGYLTTFELIKKPFQWYSGSIGCKSKYPILSNEGSENC